MKKTLMITLLSATALLLMAAPAEAKKFDDKTDIGVNFKSDEPTTPGENKPYKDNLSLVWKPTSFQFGEQKAVANTATFNNIITKDQYIVVNDDRKVALTPWKLSAKLSALQTADGTKTLTSKLQFNLEDVQSYKIGDQIGEDNDYIANRPEAVGVLGKLDEAAGITVTKAVTLEAGGAEASILATKAENTYKGGVATLIKNAKLVVVDPQKDKAAGESFTGSVTWTLDDLEK